MSELQAMIDNAGGPSNIRPSDPNNHYPGLTNFSLLTHGFGNPVVNSSLGVLQTYLQELLAYYEGIKPITVPERRYSTFGEKGSNCASGGGSGGMGPDSVGMQHGNLPMHSAGMASNGIHQNPLLYATRHYPNGGGDGRNRRCADSRDPMMEDGDGDVMVEVTLKEEPVD